MADEDDSVPAQRYRALANKIHGQVGSLKDVESRDELSSLAASYEKLALYAEAASGGLGPNVVGEPTTIQPLPATQFVVGENYDSWVCQACNAVIALAPRAPLSDPRDMPNALVNLRCPLCHAQRYYTVHERRVRQYPWNAPERVPQTP